MPAGPETCCRQEGWVNMKTIQDDTPAGNGTNGKPLPHAELEVMACIWQRGESTAREVREVMSTYRPMTHGSMVTLLKRLEAKGWLAREKAPVGKAFIYHATRRPEPTHRRILTDLVRRIFGGNGVALISTLLDSKPPTMEELDRLQKLFDDLREKRANETQDEG